MANPTPAPGLPDILARGLKVVFCGINPGMQSAALGHHFATRSNRFWRVLHLSGFTPEQILPQNAYTLLDYGYGLTSAVEKPTVGASDLRRTDFIAGRAALEQKIQQYAPRCIAFLGKPAWSAFSPLRDIHWGPQGALFAGAMVWVLPNPSGLNRAFPLTRLAVSYRELLDFTSSPAGSG